MRIFQVGQRNVSETAVLPSAAPGTGFCWIACSREEFEGQLPAIQASLQAVCGSQLVELHISDLLNRQLQSRYDYTSQYDLVIFRRLAANPAAQDLAPTRRTGPPALRRIDTAPVGCAVFDNLVLTVHPADCLARDTYAAKLLAAASEQSDTNTPRLPTSPADLMLRLVNQMVDAYLALRRDLSRQLDHWQTELLSPRTRFNNWAALLEARLTLHGLDEICEDQRTAMQDWVTSLETWPEVATPQAQRERDLLKVRGRDVLEHIERVVRHVRRREQDIEITVQMHFNAQSNRTNETMRTLTAVTAVFLPLNLITGFFGMNFEYLPLVHRESGIWWAIGFMAAIGIAFVAILWRKRYLALSGR